MIESTILKYSDHLNVSVFRNRWNGHFQMENYFVICSIIENRCRYYQIWIDPQTNYTRVECLIERVFHMHPHNMEGPPIGYGTIDQRNFNFYEVYGTFTAVPALIHNGFMTFDDDRHLDDFWKAEVQFQSNAMKWGSVAAIVGRDIMIN